MSVFDSKIFNAEVFDAYAKTIENTRVNELIKAKVFVDRTAEYKNKFAEQGGSNYVVETIKARIGGNALNYDGETDITSNSRDTFAQGKIVVGRAAAWGEKDFSTDITGGHGFEAAIAEIAQYWDDVDQDTLLAILKGIFSMSNSGDMDFVDNHTFDITEEDDSKIGVATLNSAIQKACGDRKKSFSVVIMHSAVSTNIENLNLVNHLKYTDAQGVQRDLGLYTLNGRLVLVDDGMPVDNSGEYPVYTTYVLGEGAFEYCNAGAKVPYELTRDAKTDGGISEIVSRQRKMFAPKGISFANTSIVSPSESQLEDGANWKVARNAGDTESYPHKLIPIARIVSLG